MPQLRSVAIATGSRVSPQLFQGIVPTATSRAARRKGATYVISIALHSTLALALAVLPLLLGNALPSVDSDTLFNPPLVEIRLLPPPPAAPAGGTQVARVRREVTPQPGGFVAPADVSSEIRSDYIFADSDGDGPGVIGGVLGGDRAIGSVVDVPEQAPAPPPKVVRISRIAAPQPIVRVPPRYPELAARIGLTGVVEIEAEVDTSGRVRTARVLSGHQLLIDAALAAVEQWRYRPLLLNGEPTAFILNVSVEFKLRRS